MSFVNGLFEYGALQATERLVQFTSKRHGELVNNIANINTPYFKPRDLEPAEFQASLQDAIRRRRSRTNGANPLRGQLEMRNSWNMRYTDTGIEARPRDQNENILFHDQNNKDIERMMQDLAENTMTHRLGIDMLKNQVDLLKTAIRERL